MEKFIISLCQLNVSDNKIKNVENALENIKKAASLGANIVVLPEMFNCPYDNTKFREYAEEDGNSFTMEMLSKSARINGVYIVGGSIPEKCNGKIYNTCFVFDNKGNKMGKHRKVHLFDVNIPGKLKFYESDVLNSGDDITILDTEYCKIGIAICYDMRFPEFIRIMTLKGAQVVLTPAAFNMVTGPLHWESIIKMRALDNQIFFAACSPARNEKSGYIAYGHSMIANPWGNIISKASYNEELIFGEIDLTDITKYRNELPLLKHRRLDLYQILSKNKDAY